MKTTEILLTNIQRFSLHDGPGIRTTVFLKGCSLQCPWCSNPENLVPQPQEYTKDGVSGIYGKYMTSEELLKEVLKDKAFYEGKANHWNITTANEIELLPGGVTFSGGECLLQMDKLVLLCEELHKQCIHVATETCLFVPGKNVRTAVEHIDFFYIDVKILDTEKCREVERGNIELYLSNLDMLLNSAKPVVIRIPVIGGHTDTAENRRAVKKLLNKYKDKVLKIELIKGHNLGESKYRSLGMTVPLYIGVSDELMEEYKRELDDLSIPVEIYKI